MLSEGINLWYFQTSTVWTFRFHRLKCQRSKIVGCKNIGIKISASVYTVVPLKGWDFIQFFFDFYHNKWVVFILFLITMQSFFKLNQSLMFFLSTYPSDVRTAPIFISVRRLYQCSPTFVSPTFVASDVCTFISQKPSQKGCPTIL